MSTSTPTPEQAGDSGGAVDSAVLTAPNLLTFFRILVVPVIVGSFYLGDPGGAWLALCLFALAAVSDFLDGWLARRLDQRSVLGRILDPIADKLVVAAVLVMLAAFERAPVIAVVLILSRELVISGVREALAGRTVLAATMLAKWKTTVQMLAIGGLLLVPLLPVNPAGIIGDIALGLLWLAVALTWITGFDYLRSAYRAVRNASGE